MSKLVKLSKQMNRNRQYEDSSRLSGYAMMVCILSLIGLIAYNVIVHGV